jgi:hypothetical protein
LAKHSFGMEKIYFCLNQIKIKGYDRVFFR